MNAKRMIMDAGCKGSVLMSPVNTVKAHETSLKERLAKVKRVLGMDVNQEGVLYSSLDANEQSEPYKLMTELEADIKQALLAVEKVKVSI